MLKRGRMATRGGKGTQSVVASGGATFVGKQRQRPFDGRRWEVAKEDTGGSGEGPAM